MYISLGSKKKSTGPSSIKHNAGTNKSSHHGTPGGKSVRKIEEDDSKFSHAKVGRSISKGIQKARGAKVFQNQQNQ